MPKYLLTLIIPFFVTACVSNEEMDTAKDKVQTALPFEVQGCTFLGDVDTNFAYSTIEGARNRLKLDAYQLGATHLVQTFAYPEPISLYYDFGISLSGRAYKCPIKDKDIIEHEQSDAILQDKSAIILNKDKVLDKKDSNDVVKNDVTTIVPESNTSNILK